MDELTGLLTGPRARDAFALRAVMAAPWGMEIRDEAPLTLVLVSRGAAHLEHEAIGSTALVPGDLVLLRGPRPYRVLDSAGSSIDVSVLPGQRCVDAAGASVSETMMLGGRSWGNAVDGETTMLVGSYHGDGEVGRRLLDALPEVVLLRHDATGPDDDPVPLVLPLLAAELERARPAQDVMLDRLLDLLVVAAVRRWASSSSTAAAHALTAATDPVIGPALRRIHAQPEQAWTLAALSGAASLSRSAFSRRFAAATGESSMAYLARVRLDLAADLLADPEASVSGTGAAVGYPDPFVFSAAFKRRFGVSPRAFRTRISDRAAATG